MTPTILRGTARAACGATSPNLPIWRKSQVINHRVRRMKTPTSYDRLTMPARFSPKPWDLKVPHWWISYSAGHDELDSTVVEHRAYRRSVLRRGPLEWYLSGNPTYDSLTVRAVNARNGRGAGAAKADRGAAGFPGCAGWLSGRRTAPNSMRASRSY